MKWDEKTEPLSDGQCVALRNLLDETAGSRDSHLFVLSDLLGRRVEHVEDLEVADWRRIRNEAFPFWMEQNWTIGQDFRRRAKLIVHRYQEEVLGQRDLFTTRRPGGRGAE